MSRFFALLRKYLIPLLAILVAVVGLAKLHPFGLEYNDADLILLLLGVLALDSLAERSGLLASLDNRVKRIDETLRQQDRGQLLWRRDELPQLRERVRAARSELWIAAPSLDGTVDIADEIGRMAANGVRVRLLLSTFSDVTLETYRRHMLAPSWDLESAQGKAAAVSRIGHNASILRGAVGKNGEVRVLDRMIWHGIFGIDVRSADGHMDIQMHTYRIPVQQAPMLKLTRERDADWFAFYVGAFEKLWADAEAVELVTESR